MFLRTPFGTAFEEIHRDEPGEETSACIGDVVLTGPPIVGLFKAISGALRLPGQPPRQAVTAAPSYDPYGFRRSTRHTQSELAWEMHHVKQEAVQELLWAQYDVDSGNMLATAPGVSQLVRGGIPSWRRKAIWPVLLQAEALRATSPPNHFYKLLELAAREPVSKIDDQACIEQVPTIL